MATGITDCQVESVATGIDRLSGAVSDYRYYRLSGGVIVATGIDRLSGAVSG